MITRQKCPSQNISNIAFNEKDTCLVIVSSDGFLYRWDLVSFTKKGEGSIDRNCDFRSCAFINNDPKDEFKVIAVGSENQKALFRVYNQKEDVELNVQCTENRKYTDVAFIKSFTNGIENLIVGSALG